MIVAGPDRAARVFETWAQSVYGLSSVLNGFNLQSIAVFAAAPLLLGLGHNALARAQAVRRSLEPRR